MPQGSFVQMEMASAQTVRSNLGGVGGRCHMSGSYACDEPATDPPDAATPHELYLRDCARNSVRSEYNGGAVALEQYVDLRITNLTEYHAYATQWNGVRGQFANINLRSPMSSGSSGYVWNSEMTFVELRIEFLGRTEAWDAARSAREQTDAAQPLVLRRTFFGFFDFDGFFGINGLAWSRHLERGG